MPRPAVADRTGWNWVRVPGPVLRDLSHSTDAPRALIEMYRSGIADFSANRGRGCNVVSSYFQAAVANGQVVSILSNGYQSYSGRYWQGQHYDERISNLGRWSMGLNAAGNTILVGSGVYSWAGGAAAGPSAPAISPNEPAVPGPPVAFEAPDVPPNSLTPQEIAAAQAIADKYNTEVDVVGSRASGAARNIETDLPVGKQAPGGPPTRSDIDFRIDHAHPCVDQLIAELEKVGNGAGRAGTQWSNNPAGGVGRPSFPPVIRFKPRPKAGQQ